MVAPMRDAVAAIFHCQGKIFMIRRQNHLRVFPGYHAFPGGKIDADESDKEYEVDFLKGETPRVVRALCREIGEELSFDLEKAIEMKDVEEFDLLSITHAPEYLLHRFRIYFYKIKLKSMPAFITADGEIAESMWLSPQEMLDIYDQGRALMVPATRRLVEGMAKNIDVKIMRDVGSKHNLDISVPFSRFMKDFFQAAPTSSALFPATRTNAFIIGDDDNGRILVDPSPKDAKELKKFLHTIKKCNITKILITHHHVDHSEHLSKIAISLGVPVLMTKITRDLLISANDRHFFTDLMVTLVKDGDRVAYWLDREVIVHDLSGHADGQIGLAASDMSWFVVGDLFQGIGTVVVEDIVQYMNSLQKVIELKPKYIFPSHGMGLGGINLLQKIVEHRLMREEQILELHGKDMDIEHILKTIYFDTHPKLLPYARKNIEAHLAKLQNEGKI